MKIAIISKALINSAYHRKLEELARNSDLELLAVAPLEFKGKKAEPVKPVGYRLEYRRLFFSNSFHVNFFSGIFPLLKEFAPDIIHIDDEPYNLVSWQLVKIAGRLGARCVFTTLQTIDKKYPGPFAFFEKQMFQAADGALAVTEDALKLLRKRGFTKKAAAIPYGVAREDFQRPKNELLKKSLGLKNESFVIGYIGRVAQEKGLGLLTEALADFPVQYQVLVVGQGPYRNSFILELKRRGILNNFIFVGAVFSEKIPDYLSCLDCLVLPSLKTNKWQEQFGRVLIEAMAAGVPVVAARSGEIPRVVGDVGMLFETGRAEDLKKCLKELAVDLDLRGILQAAGRQRVENLFLNKTVSRASYEFYRKIMGL